MNADPKYPSSKSDTRTGLAGMAANGTAASDLEELGAEKELLLSTSGAAALIHEPKRGREMLMAALFALCIFLCLVFTASRLAGPPGRAGRWKTFASEQVDVSMASRVFGMSVPRRVARKDGGGGGREGEERVGGEGGEGTGRGIPEDSILGAVLANIGSFMSEPMVQLASGGATAATADVRARRAEHALEHGIDFLLMPRQDDPDNVGLSLVEDQLEGEEAKRSTGLLEYEDQGDLETIYREYVERQQLDKMVELKVENIVVEAKGEGAGKRGEEGGGREAGIDSKPAGGANEGDVISGSRKQKGSGTSNGISGDKGNALKSTQDSRELTYVQEELFDVVSIKYGAKNTDIEDSGISDDDFLLKM